MKRQRKRKKLKPYSFRNHTFDQLLAKAPGLAEARRDYIDKSAEDRRAAAEWNYDAAIASDMFRVASMLSGVADFLENEFEPGAMALAIDPLFAPALLTVGSMEYQAGHREAGMQRFMALTTLPPDEPDLHEIIDKAGCFLLDQKEVADATRLYRTATEFFPDVCAHWSSLSYCLGTAGHLDEAVRSARKALDLNESDPHVLNDLGWTLVLSGQYEEAQKVLEMAVKMAPLDYERPSNNLIECKNRMLNAPNAGGNPNWCLT